MAFDANEWHRENQRAARAKGREVSQPPPCADTRLRNACRKSLYKFGMTCFPETFCLKPSPDHKRLADEIQSAIEHGTKRAIAVQRGFGKTSWCTVAVLWAALTGRVDMIMLICGNQDAADVLRDGLVTTLETNDTLYALFPEIVHFFRETRMHGANMKATFQGEPINLKRRPDVIFPMVPFAGSECCIRVAGIDSKGVRGAHHVRSDGKRARPRVVLLDDPQDDDLARSETEVNKRERKIKKTIHGLAGPGDTLSVLMPCTPIEKNDLAERFLDRNKTPEYQGIKWPALDSFPTCFEDTENNLWTAYFEKLAEDFADGLDTHPNATALYKKHRKKMSAGAKIRWKARVEGACIDALQSLMNRYAEGRQAFMSEFQMSPANDDGDSLYLDDAEIAGCFNRLKRGQLPDGIEHVTTAIDVQKRLLYWKSIAWTTDGKGFIFDYGTFPKQPRPQFTHNDAPNTMEKFVRAHIGRGYSWEECLQECLRRCIRERRDPSIGPVPEVILVDARWNESRTPVLDVCVEDEFSDIAQVGGGVFVGGGDVPISARVMPPGSRRPSKGVEWYFKRAADGEVLYWDANYYRSKFQGGLATEAGKPGSITFYGRLPNQILAEHFGAKACSKKEGTKRDIEEWKNKPGRTNDHWLDCAVMCRVGLELLGFRTAGEPGRNVTVKKQRGGRSSKKVDPDKLKKARQRAQRRVRA